MVGVVGLEVIGGSGGNRDKASRVSRGCRDRGSKG